MKKEKNSLYSFCRVLYSLIMKILYQPKVIGKENIPNDGALIFAGNHRKALDPIVVMMSTERMVHFMAKAEIFKGLHGKVFEKIGLIKIYRGQGKSNPLAIIEAEKILSNNGTIGIFPEGTRNRTKEDLLKFKYGAVTLAKRTDSKIVPFAIKGEYKLFRRKLIIEFGKPINVTNMEKEEANNYLKNEVLMLFRK